MHTICFFLSCLFVHLFACICKLQNVCGLSLSSQLYEIFSFQELLAEFRQELDAAKREIIEGKSVEGEQKQAQKPVGISHLLCY